MKAFHVGIKGLIREDQGILLLKHRSGFWDVPGGRIDGDEDFEDTLRRELAEELPGAMLTFVGALQGAHRIHRDIEEGISLVLLYFLIEAKLPKKLVFGDEHHKVLWVKNRGDIPKTDINPGMAKILDNILQKQ